MLSVSQDELSREMLLSKYRLQIFDYIKTISNPSSFEMNWVFFMGAKIIPPPYKTLGWGPIAPCGHYNVFSRDLQQLKSIGSGICNPLENV
jgi:hypothetical protein